MQKQINIHWLRKSHVRSEDSAPDWLFALTNRRLLNHLLVEESKMENELYPSSQILFFYFSFTI